MSSGQNNMHMLKNITLGAGDNSIVVKIRSSKRARNYAIRMSNLKGVELVIPFQANINQAYQFLLQKETWVKNKYSQLKRPENIIINIGSRIPILGVWHTIVASPANAIHHDHISLRSYEGNISSWELKRILFSLLRLNIETTAQKIAHALDVTYKKISIRDTRSRWGSCSSSRNLSFSWRLVFAPADVVAYVVAHELSHLCEMNHSPKFWKLVQKVCPHYKQARSWLRINGHTLHSYLL